MRRRSAAPTWRTSRARSVKCKKRSAPLSKAAKKRPTRSPGSDSGWPSYELAIAGRSIAIGGRQNRGHSGSDHAGRRGHADFREDRDLDAADAGRTGASSRPKRKSRHCAEPGRRRAGGQAEGRFLSAFGGHQKSVVQNRRCSAPAAERFGNAATRIIKTIRDWVNRHRELVVTVSKLVTGLIAVGGGPGGRGFGIQRIRHRAGLAGAAQRRRSAW